MVKQFLLAMNRWRKSGFACVDKEEYIRRRKICRKCNNGRGWCPVCSCNIVFKTALKTERCPNGLW